MSVKIKIKALPKIRGFPIHITRDRKMSVTYFFLFLSAAAMLAADAATMPEGLRRILASVNTEDKPPRVNQAEVEEARRRYDSGDFSKYMPAPLEEEAQCYIEYQVTMRKPGRCIKLGGHTPACQSNEYISINYNSCS